MKKLLACVLTLAVAFVLSLGAVGCKKDDKKEATKETTKETAKETTKETVKETAKETVKKKDT